MSNPAKLSLSEDAAIVLALAETAIPFAATHEDEAERWVRLLRLHGQVGGVLQALGVGEAPLETMADRPSSGARGAGRPIVAEVSAAATRYAAGRGAKLVATVDVLFAVLEIYGRAFDRALYVRGATREELIERLAAAAASAAS
jgi:hypothetical protein